MSTKPMLGEGQLTIANSRHGSVLASWAKVKSQVAGRADARNGLTYISRTVERQELVSGRTRRFIPSYVAMHLCQSAWTQHASPTPAKMVLKLIDLGPIRCDGCTRQWLATSGFASV